MEPSSDATPPPIPIPGEVRDLVFDLYRPRNPGKIGTAVDHAYDSLWRQLMHRERKPGERLTDTDISAQLGLSRTPVRQALHRLAQEELVRFDPRRGFSVRIFTSQDVHEIYDMRGALEALAVQLSAAHLSAKDIETQLACLNDARRRLQSELDEPAILLHLKTDLDLHDLIIRASGNGRLIRTLAALRSQQLLFQYWDTWYPQRNEAAADEHERVLTALSTGNVQHAATYMAEHIQNAKDRVLSDLFHFTGEASPRHEAAEHMAAAEPVRSKRTQSGYKSTDSEVRV